MENVSVTYIGTELKEIKDNRKLDEELQAVHYLYIYPSIEVDGDNKTAVFSVGITSQFECQTMAYRLTTSSSFVFEKFIVHENRYEVLEDHVFFALRKHTSILEEKLNYHPYTDKIKHVLEPFQYKNAIETILYFAAKKAEKV
jgi:hypothetical protein